MDLRSGLPFSLVKYGLPFDYPKLESPIRTDAVIIGGGISGALMAYHLTEAGISSVVVDARTIGLGSTAASTSLLQYEIDVPLIELIEKRGRTDAERAFMLCREAIEKLHTIAEKISVKNFELRKSLYFASAKKDLPFLKKEFGLRRQSGFRVEYLDDSEVYDQYRFKAPGAILSHHGAQTDAYVFSHSLLQHSIEKGLSVYDRTAIQSMRHHDGHTVLRTENGNTIHAAHVINATGYEVVNFIKKKIVKFHSTYAVISEHREHKIKDWNNDTLFWNTADPYLYMSSTLDGRLLVGGRDEDYYNPTRRDKLIKNKAKQLTGDFARLFPHIPFNPEFSWTGTFGSTTDGLPFIGAYGHKNVYYALGFGGNGITFSLIAAEIITDLICGKKNGDAKIFGFERL